MSVYQVTIDEPAQTYLDALPPEGLQAWHELRKVLELCPWNGRPMFLQAPDGLMSWEFGPDGEGLAVYLVIEHARQVAVLEVHWLG